MARFSAFFFRLHTRIGSIFVGGGVGLRGFHLRFSIGFSVHESSFRFFYANVFVIAGFVVTFFLGDVVIRFCPSDAGVVGRLFRRFVTGFNIGLGNFFFPFGFSFANVFGVFG